MNRSDLIANVLKGDVGAAAKAITLVEEGGEAALSVMRTLYPHSGGSHRIGLTGPPGAGKSTLVGALTAELRQKNQRVGILAVDATSPFTGGALLGDRIRMQSHARDPDVFIRSMGSGGATGGLNGSSLEAIRVMEAMGKGVVIVETVGVGQAEVDVFYQVDTMVAVLVPESGDEIQAMKAGILEAADVVVVNKADRPGAEALALELVACVGARGDWEVPVITVCATAGEGVAELVKRLDSHAGYLANRDNGSFGGSFRGSSRRRDQLERELATRNDEALLAEVLAGKATPYGI